jgi:hypothetical protein
MHRPRQSPDRTHTLCLTAAAISFLVWVLNSAAVSGTVGSVARLIGKFTGN